MGRIVTQDKLNELTGMSIDYGKGGGYCPHYQTIIGLWGGVVASSNYQPNQLVREEDIITKQCFMVGVAQAISDGAYNFVEFYTDNSVKIVPAPDKAVPAFTSGCADPITGVVLFPDSSAIVVRSSNGVYERKSIGFTSYFVYNVPGEAFYVVAGGTGKIAEVLYNEGKTSVGAINLLSTSYLGAGPFDVSDQYFHTVTTSQVSVYEKPTTSSRLGESVYSASKTNALTPKGQPQFMNVIMTPEKDKLVLVNIKGASTDDYDAVVVPISAGEPMSGETLTFDITRGSGVFMFSKLAGPHIIVPIYARTSTTWPASYLVYYNNAFRTIKYGSPTVIPISDITYSPTNKKYYAVPCSPFKQIVYESTYNGTGLLESGNPLSAFWVGSSINLPEGFWTNYRLGYLTALK
mgnify:CR=1 FL=1